MQYFQFRASQRGLKLQILNSNHTNTGKKTTCSTSRNKYRRKQKYSVNVLVQNQKIGIPVTSRRDVINSLTETTMADDSSKLKEQIAYLTSK